MWHDISIAEIAEDLGFDTAMGFQG